MTIKELRIALLNIPEKFDDHAVILNLPIFDNEDLMTPEKYEEVALTDSLHLVDEYEFHLFGEVA